MLDDDGGPRAILARNVANLMRASVDARRDMSSPLKFEAAAKVRGLAIGHSQINRIRNGQTGVAVDVLGPLAAVFGLEPWQLLVPGLRAHVDEQGRLRAVAPILPDLSAVERQLGAAMGALSNLTGHPVKIVQTMGAEDVVPESIRRDAEAFDGDTDNAEHREPDADAGSRGRGKPARPGKAGKPRKTTGPGVRGRH